MHRNWRCHQNWVKDTLLQISRPLPRFTKKTVRDTYLVNKLWTNQLRHDLHLRSRAMQAEQAGRSTADLQKLSSQISRA